MDTIKAFWETHKKKILWIGGGLGLLTAVYFMFIKKDGKSANRSNQKF